MLQELAQKIAVSTSEIIGHDVIITDEKSIIIGASDVSRLGEYHEASVKIIATGKPNPDNLNIKGMKGTKPGIALTIDIFGKTIGTFGISGERKDVKKFADLVKKYMEIILYQEVQMRSTVLRERALRNLIQEISTFNPQISDESLLITRANELGYDLKPPYIAIVIKIISMEDLEKPNKYEADEEQFANIKMHAIKSDVQNIIENYFSSTNEIIVPLGNDNYVILHHLNSKKQIPDVKNRCLKIIDRYRKNDILVRIGMGLIANNVYELGQSYKDAWRAIEIGNKLENPPNLLNIHDLFLEDFVSNIQLDISKRYISHILKKLKDQPDWKELSRTIYAWAESGFNQMRASKALYIHRNTLNYRLDKIQRITGIDLKDYKKTFMLYLAVLMTNMC
ncbi:CdaR family transcriptional regulator [Scopulibacillus cellulosilyticus]|uniref:CdaR family transcriptional regulator n=1 Tax=Scopulibacillus cellulosilyticus TaxID=2665665 RepID=A0ABW2PY18_9BACL